MKMICRKRYNIRITNMISLLINWVMRSALERLLCSASPRKTTNNLHGFSNHRNSWIWSRILWRKLARTSEWRLSQDQIWWTTMKTRSSSISTARNFPRPTNQHWVTIMRRTPRNTLISAIVSEIIWSPSKTKSRNTWRREHRWAERRRTWRSTCCYQTLRTSSSRRWSSSKTNIWCSQWALYSQLLTSKFRNSQIIRLLLINTNTKSSK